MLGYNLPQKVTLKGVIKIAPAVDSAVMVTDNAVSPLPVCVMKFETFPPGQEATMIIPNATLGGGLMIMISKKVSAGITKNCANTPINGPLGERIARLKSSRLKSSETPNMINPRTMFNAISPD